MTTGRERKLRYTLRIDSETQRRSPPSHLIACEVPAALMTGTISALDAKTKTSEFADGYVEIEGYNRPLPIAVTRAPKERRGAMLKPYAAANGLGVRLRPPPSCA